MLRGDFGGSLLSGASVTDELREKLAVTGPLVLAASVLAVLVPSRSASGRRRGAAGRTASALGMASQLGIAVPTFWVGLMLVALFAVRLAVLPSQGFPTDGWGDPAGRSAAWCCRPSTLALCRAPSCSGYVRSAMLDVLGRTTSAPPAPRASPAAGAAPARAAQRGAAGGRRSSGCRSRR